MPGCSRQSSVPGAEAGAGGAGSAWQRGAGCPHPHHKIHVKDASAGSCLFPPRRGEDTGTLVTPGTTPPTRCLPIPPGTQPPPALPPGPPSPERRRDQLLSGTGGSFVTLLLLSHAGASPSPSSRHRVPPPRPSHSPPRAASPRSGRDICQRDGATPVPAPGRGRSAGGSSGGISGVPARGHSG